MQPSPEESTGRIRPAWPATVNLREELLWGPDHAGEKVGATYPAVPKVGDIENVVHDQDACGSGAVFPGRFPEETCRRWSLPTLQLPGTGLLSNKPVP